MALFWQKGNKETTVAKPEKVTKKPVAKKADKPAKTAKAVAKGESVADKRTAAVSGGVTFPKGGVVVKPRITEKSGQLSQNGIYTFEVRKDSNSAQISAAIKEAYKVTPVKISVVAMKSKRMFSKGKKGRTVSGKKAYVYLKDGDKIEFI